MRQAMRFVLPGLLLGTLLVTATACSSSTQQQVASCIKEAVFTLAQNAFTDEKFSLTDALQVGQVCVPAAIAVFNDSQPTVQPTFSLPSLGTSVQLNEDSTDYTTPVPATSEVIPNCGKLGSLSGSYHYSVPFAMIVGNATSATTFKDFPTTDSSDEGLIAESVYEQDGLAQQTTPDTAPTPYSISVQPIAPGTQATLQFTVTIHYRVGAARILRNGAPGAVEVYLYDISFDPPTAAQITQQSAPLAAANCP